MKRIVPIAASVLLLAGCTAAPPPECQPTPTPETTLSACQDLDEDTMLGATLYAGALGVAPSPPPQMVTYSIDGELTGRMVVRFTYARELGTRTYLAPREKENTWLWIPNAESELASKALPEIDQAAIDVLNHCDEG